MSVPSIAPVFALILMLSPAWATSVPIGDFSFENNTLSEGGATFDLSPEWQETGGVSNFLGFEAYTAGFAAEGTDHLAMLSGHSVWQDLGTTFQANTVYTLTAAVGSRTGLTTAGNASTYTIGTPDGSLTTFTSFNASALPAGTFADAPTLTFDTALHPAAVGQPIRITLSASGGGETYFDHLRLETSFSQSAGTSLVFSPSVSNLDLFSATLSGVVLAVGDSDPAITFFYGLADGQNEATAWDSSLTLPGTQAAFSSFSADLAPLLRNQTYFVRTRALNSAGESWSQSVTSFQTPDGTPAIASLDSGPVIAGDLATISWQINTAASAPLTSLSLDQGIGDVLALTDANGAGSAQVAVTEDTLFTLSAATVYGVDFSSVLVKVLAPKITEFVANTSDDGLRDEDGEVNDWIELHNSADLSADLSTYYLTDDAAIPNQWAFPAVALAPDGYLVVFASGKDRSATSSELHANFSLSSGGEYLALTRDDGNGGFIVVQEFAPSYPEQIEESSYGLNANGETFYFANPTSGALNAGNGVVGFVEDTSFDVDRGFFTAPFDLTISSLTADAVIRYTTDGSEPTATTGFVYTVPITIAGTTIIRAAAFKDGFGPTDVDLFYPYLDD